MTYHEKIQYLPEIYYSCDPGPGWRGHPQRPPARCAGRDLRYLLKARPYR